MVITQDRPTYEEQMKTLRGLRGRLKSLKFSTVYVAKLPLIDAPTLLYKSRNNIYYSFYTFSPIRDTSDVRELFAPAPFYDVAPEEEDELARRVLFTKDFIAGLKSNRAYKIALSYQKNKYLTGRQILKLSKIIRKSAKSRPVTSLEQMVGSQRLNDRMDFSIASEEQFKSSKAMDELIMLRP